MNSIRLLTKIYGPLTGRLFGFLKSKIAQDFENLDVKVLRVATDKRNHVEISIEGADSEFAINHLANQYGKCFTPRDITSNTILRGHLIDVGRVGFGIYVDVGIEKAQRLDPLLPLHVLRKQVGVNKPLRSIANAVQLVENLPVEIRVTDVDTQNNKVEAELGPETTMRLNSWIQDDHERLLVFGANQATLEDTLRKSKHLEDIYHFEPLGLFEIALVCKRSTRASGILAAIGPRLRGVPMYLFIPKEIEVWRDDQT